MKGTRVFSIFIFSILISAQAWAATAYDHGPIGVMGEHLHRQGEWMVSYRHMTMNMDHNYIGDRQITVDEVHNDFMMAPTDMEMDMQMVGVMYAPSDSITLMAMAPYIHNKMTVQNRAGARIKIESEGLGDVKLSGLFKLHKDARHSFILNAGISLPTGSIKERDRTLMGGDIKLAYPMQLGSGTYDAPSGLTYVYTQDQLNLGGQVMGNFRMGGMNSQGYQLGNEVKATTWASYQWFEWISSSLRFEYTHKGDIKGQDTELNPVMMPTAAPNKHGGERVDVFLGLNLMGIHDGWSQGHRLAIEWGLPIYQYLEGPQLGIDSQITIGYQYAF